MRDPEAQLEDSLKPNRFYWVFVHAGQWFYPLTISDGHCWLSSEIFSLEFFGKSQGENQGVGYERKKPSRSFVQRFFSRMEERMSRLSTYKLDSLTRGRVKTKAGNIILVWITTSISYNNIFHQKILFAQIIIFVRVSILSTSCVPCIVNFFQLW
jgi:hypothetical protein